MKLKEFNEKWKSYLVDNHYGLAIDHPNVIEYLDKEFTKEVDVNKGFKYYQIKMKFSFSRVYADTDKDSKWEQEINKLVK